MKTAEPRANRMVLVIVTNLVCETPVRKYLIQNRPFVPAIRCVAGEDFRCSSTGLHLKVSRPLRIPLHKLIMATMLDGSVPSTTENVSVEVASATVLSLTR